MTQNLIFPTSATRTHAEFFSREAETIAKDLLGRILVFERKKPTLYARLLEIAAYEGETKTMYEGALYAPGTFAISTKHGRKLIDISTNKICVPSCITLIAAEVYERKGNSRLVEGPGKLAEALEIDGSYNGVPLNFCGIWVGGEGVEADKISKRNLSGLPKNCRGYFYIK